MFESFNKFTETINEAKAQYVIKKQVEKMYYLICLAIQKNH